MSRSSWSRIFILLRRGYCGNGIHCTGSLATSVSGHSVPPTEADPLMPAEADPLASTEGVFSHSVTSTEGVSCHSVPPTETAPLTSTEERSQMNCASISDTAETPDSSSVRVVGSNNHSLSITDLPLTQDKVESTMQTYSKVLVNFQEILTS